MYGNSPLISAEVEVIVPRFTKKFVSIDLTFSEQSTSAKQRVRWTDRPTGARGGGPTARETDEHTERRMDCQQGRSANKRKDSGTDGQIKGRMNRQKDRQTDEQTEGPPEGRMKRQTAISNIFHKKC